MARTTVTLDLNEMATSALALPGVSAASVNADHVAVEFEGVTGVAMLMTADGYAELSETFTWPSMDLKEKHVNLNTIASVEGIVTRARRAALTRR